jgi:predicted ATP-grasp superfamily ATP-dependent carboligase
MLAQLAAADGYEVTALDRFGDVDLRAIAPGATAPNNDALAALADDIDADAVVYGGGLENRPDLVGRLSRDRELLGTPPELLAAVRDPWAVSAAARAAGARAPETRSVEEPPRAGLGGTWLRKPRHGGGGRGVRRWAGRRLRPTEILQRRVYGLSCSAVAIGDGRRAAVLGSTEQLHRAPGFQWTGNLTPPRLPDAERAELDGRLRAVCDEIAARFGVRGAFGVDAIWDGRHAWVLEVNPRAPASLELFGPGCFEAHVRGSRGLGRGWFPNPGHAAGDEVCEGEARAVRPPRPSGARSRLVADRTGARHPAGRRDDHTRCAGVHADLGGGGPRGAGDTRGPPAGRASRGGARPWLSSGPSPAPGVACCATT